MAILFLLVYFIRFSFLAESSVASSGPLVVCAVVQRIVQAHANDSVVAVFERSLMFIEFAWVVCDSHGLLSSFHFVSKYSSAALVQCVLDGFPL